MLLFLLFLGSERCKFEKWPADNALEDDIVQMLDEWWVSVEKFRAPVTCVEINKHKIFDVNNAWITELYFQKPPPKKT